MGARRRVSPGRPVYSRRRGQARFTLIEFDAWPPPALPPRIFRAGSPVRGIAPEDSLARAGLFHGMGRRCGQPDTGDLFIAHRRDDVAEGWARIGSRWLVIDRRGCGGNWGGEG